MDAGTRNVGLIVRTPHVQTALVLTLEPRCQSSVSSRGSIMRLFLCGGFLMGPSKPPVKRHRWIDINANVREENLELHPYIAMAKKGNWIRAVDYFFSSSLMLVVTSILFRSPPDVPTLMLVGAVQGSIILVGYLLERIQAEKKIGRATRTADQNEGCFTRLKKWFSGLGDNLRDNSDIAGPFLASMFVFGVAWASLLIPFGYAVSNAPVAVSAVPSVCSGFADSVQGHHFHLVPGGHVSPVSDCVHLYETRDWSRDGVPGAEHARQGTPRSGWAGGPV